MGYCVAPSSHFIDEDPGAQLRDFSEVTRLFLKHGLPLINKAATERVAHEGTLGCFTLMAVSAEQWERASVQSIPFLPALPTGTGSTCPIASRGPEPVHVYSFQFCTLLFYFYWPCGCVCSWSSLHTYCRRPCVYLSSGLNITSAIARDILTCQPLSSVCANATAAYRPGTGTNAGFISWEFTLKWEL